MNSPSRKVKQRVGHGGRKEDAVELIKWAKRYIKHGYAVFLCAPGSKKPFENTNGFKDATKNLAIIRKLAEKYPDANLAIATGRISKLFALDLDLYKPGVVDLIKELESRHGTLPSTLVQRTPRGGEHRLFSCAVKTISWQANLGAGFDVRGDGGYVMVEPSMFESKAYRWDGSPEDIVEIPSNWKDTLVAAKSNVAAAKVRDGESIPKGRRNGTLWALAWNERNSGVTRESAREYLLEVNNRQCEPPMKPDEVVGIVERAFKFTPSTMDEFAMPITITGRPLRQVKTFADIAKMKLKPLVWVLRGILPTGVAICAGATKIGKSFWMLQAALAVTRGGRLWKGRKRERKGEVLYISYEDNDRRLKGRVADLLGKKDPVLKGLFIDYHWPRMDQGGFEDLEKWLAAHPKTRLVVIDTLGRFRPTTTKSRTAYDYDYAVGSKLSALAERHKVAILVVHHTAKGKRLDPLESINSTNGLPAGMDTVMIMNRLRGQSVGELFVTGRDIKEERHWVIEKDTKLGWRKVGDYDRVMMSDERKLIVDILKVNGPLDCKAIAQHAKKDEKNIKHMLWKMSTEGVIDYDRGKYSNP